MNNDGMFGFSEINDFKDGEFSTNSKTGFHKQDFYDFPAFFKWTNGLNPILYLGAFHPAILEPSGVQEGENVTGLNNYFGSGGNTTASGGTIPVLRVVDGKKWIHWIGNGFYTWGNSESLKFINEGEFTLFFVWKPIKGENTGTTMMFIANSNNTGQRGFIFGAFLSGNVRTPLLRIDRAVAGQVAFQLQFPSYDNRKEIEPMIFSVRVKGRNHVKGDLVGRAYFNGEFYQDIILDNPFELGNATNTPNIGRRQQGDLYFRGYFGELLIFDKIISEEVHQQIIYHLKLKYKI